MRESNEAAISVRRVLTSLFLFFGSVGAKCVSDIVGHTVEPNVEAIDQTLDDYLEVYEDSDTWYSFHEFIEDRDG